MDKGAQAQFFEGYSYKVSLNTHLDRQITGLIDRKDAFNVDYEQNIINKFSEIKTQAYSMEGLDLSLAKMFNRSLLKKRLGNHGILGRIRMRIWSWFYDKQKAVATIRNQIVSTSAIFATALKTIQDRIFLNMSSFEEAITDFNTQQSIDLVRQRQDLYRQNDVLEEQWSSVFARISKLKSEGKTEEMEKAEEEEEGILTQIRAIKSQIQNQNQQSENRIFLKTEAIDYFDVNANEAKYPKPKIVTQKWVQKYHGDQFQLLEIPEEKRAGLKKILDVRLQRIIIMNRIWANLLEIQSGNLPIPVQEPAQAPLLVGAQT